MSKSGKIMVTVVSILVGIGLLVLSYLIGYQVAEDYYEPIVAEKEAEVQEQLKTNAGLTEDLTYWQGLWEYTYEVIEDGSFAGIVRDSVKELYDEKETR
jgi:hypothetical protein